MKKEIGYWIRLGIAVALLTLCTRARVADGFAPFACAAYAAFRLKGHNPLALLLGVGLGCASAGFGLAAWQPLAGCAVVELLCRAPYVRRMGAEAQSALLALAGALLPGVLFSCGILYNLLGALLCATVSMAAAPMLVPIAGLERGKTVYSREEQLAAAAFAVIAVVGLRATPAQGACAALIVIAASEGGAGTGALAGVLMGAALTFSGGQPESAAVMGMAGALCGVLGHAPKWVRALAFLAVCQTAYLGPFGYSLPAAPFEQALAGALFALLLPAERLRGWLAVGENREKRRIGAEAAKRVRAMASALDEMAGVSEEERAGIDESAALAAMRKALCADCPARAACWSGDNSQASRTLLMLFGGALPMEDEPLPAVARVCRQAAKMKERLSPVIHEFEGLRRWNLRRAEGARLMQREFAQLRDSLLPLAAALETQRLPERKPKLHARAGVSVRAKEEVCGDSYAMIPLPDGRLLIAICDGMGTGEAARNQSERAIRLVTRLMQSGADAERAIETANTLMLWRDSEAFSTLDLAVIDLCTAQANLYKLAAPPSLHLRGDSASEIGGGNLPIGVLEDAHPAVAQVSLRCGDVLFMGSDGVMDLHSAEEIATCIRSRAGASPRAMCEAITGSAENVRDDMTAIVVKLM